MAREVTSSIPVRPETKEMVRDAIPKGMEYDLWVRQDPRLQGEQ